MPYFRRKRCVAFSGLLHGTNPRNADCVAATLNTHDYLAKRKSPRNVVVDCVSLCSNLSELAFQQSLSADTEAEIAEPARPPCAEILVRAAQNEIYLARKANILYLTHRDNPYTRRSRGSKKRIYYNLVKLYSRLLVSKNTSPLDRS